MKVREMSEAPQEQQDQKQSGSERLSANLRNPIRGWKGYLLKWAQYMRRKVIMRLLPTSVDGWVNRLDELHLAFFFIFGRFYELSRRLVCLRYVFRSQRPDHKISYSLPGRLLMLKLVFQGFMCLKDLVSCGIESAHQIRKEFS